MKYIRHFNSQEDYEEFISSLTEDQTVLAGGPEGIKMHKGVPPIDYSKVAMFFENIDTHDVIIGVKKSYSYAYTATLETSTDGETWEYWGSTSEYEMAKIVPVGGKLYVRATSNVGYFNDTEYSYNYFTSTGDVNMGGNIMSLGYKDFEDKIIISQEAGYSNVFYNMTNLVDTSKLVLPATTLAQRCYQSMFDGCASLTTAPELPATTLTEGCYQYMFGNCTSLTTAPELPATTLAEWCYYSMFYSCTALTTAQLPATTLVDGCYGYIFQNCSNLNYIKALFTTEPGNLYTPNWVSGVANSGVFVKNAAATWDVIGVNGIPTDWTVKYDVKKVTSIEIVDETEIPSILYANQSSISASVRINYIKQDNTAGSNVIALKSNSFGINDTGSDRQVTVLFEYEGKTASVIRTQVIEINSLYDPMYFENVDEQDVTIGVKKSSYSAYTATLETSTDGETWTNWGSTNITALTKTVPVGGKLYVRASSNPGYFNNNSGSYYNYFTSTGKVNVCGNIMSLGYKDFKNETSITQNYAYRNVFYNMTNLVDASELVLPATTLTAYCYQYMFFGCSSLTTAPELPATTLANYCYQCMFQGCSKLNYIKALFTTTPSNAYTQNWVDGVASIGTFVKNPAATWDVPGTYGIPGGWIMKLDVKEVTSIEIVDETEIPSILYANQGSVIASVRINYIKQDNTTGSNAITLKSNSFGINNTGSDRQVTVLFEYEGKTTSVIRTQGIEINSLYDPMYFENIDTQDVTIGVQKTTSSAITASLQISTDGSTWEDWGSTSTTALTKSVEPGGKLYVRVSSNPGYFNNSTSNYNYFTSTGNVNVGGNIMSLGYNDFEDKTSIAQNYIYNSVFINMTNLVDASKLVLPATTLDSYSMCYAYMFKGCTSLTTAPEILPATKLSRGCYEWMFDGCTSLTTAPVLPAATLATNCYKYMFQNCTSLTTAPVLPVITLPDALLAGNCYGYMFNGCSSLNYIKALFTNTPGDFYTQNWVTGVSSTGTFVKNAAATWDVTGNNGIPEGWTVETA